jgi:hypothetical protein
VEAVDEEALPGVVLQNQVPQQVVMGMRDAQIIRGGAIGLIREENVRRENRLRSQSDRSEEEEG